MIGAPQTTFSTRAEGIGHLLRDRRLQVPPFQRSYAWTESEVDAFWSDLNEALSLDDPEYFLGTIVLSETSGAHATIIDGQQRLATVALLFAAIRDAFAQRGDSDRALVIERDYLAGKSIVTAQLEPHLSLNTEDDDYFQHLILSPLHESGAGSALLSHRRLRAARQLFSERILNEASKARANWARLLLRWVEFLDQKARVILVSVPNDSDAFLIFETVNDRGVELTIADLLRNHLFSLARNRLQLAQRGWQTAVASLDTSVEDQSFVTFLRHYWNSYHGATRERDLYKNLKRNITTQKSALEFIQELGDAAPQYAALQNPDDELWEELKIPPELVHTLLRLELAQNRPLLISAMQLFTRRDFESLLRALVSWSVRGLVVGGIGGGTTERYYSDVAVKLRQGRARTVRDIEKELDPIIPSDDEFFESFARARASRARLARYYLLAIDRARRGIEDASLVSREEETHAALVYVLPRNAEPAEWQMFTEDELAQMVLRLGNRALVDVDVRREFEGADIGTKERLLQESTYLTTSEIAEMLPWLPQSIRNRQQELARTAIRVWPRHAQ
jgi:hypothetical protein